MCNSLESVIHAENNKPDETRADANTAENEAELVANGAEYAKNTYGIKSRNNTAKNIPTAILPFWRYSGIINLLRPFHSVDQSRAQTASIRWSPRTIFILNPPSLTFLPSAPSSIISCLTPSWVPILS